MTRLALSIASTHPAFAGHFPSRPIVPGVVLLDVSLRAIGATLLADGDDFASAICQIAAAKFLSPVVPGEPLWLEVESPRKGAVESGATSESYAMRVLAGDDMNERVAVTATVSFQLRAQPA